MSGLSERLDALKAKGVIAGYEAPHPNRGLSGGLLPWVVMHIDGGPSSLYYSDNDLSHAIQAMRLFGPPHGLSPSDFMERN